MYQVVNSPSADQLGFGPCWGRASVSKRIPLPFKILEENNAGVLISPENSQDFAQAIMKQKWADICAEELNWESVAK